jgi:hypothetical protein
MSSDRDLILYICLAAVLSLSLVGLLAVGMRRRSLSVARRGVAMAVIVAGGRVLLIRRSRPEERLLAEYVPDGFYPAVQTYLDEQLPHRG